MGLFIFEDFWEIKFNMTLYDILLTGVALSMDAVAVGMTNGMAEPRMKWGKVFLIAFFYGFFQFLMPMLGYVGGSLFTSLVAKIAPYLSFALLLFIGGKMIAESMGGDRDEFTPLGKGKRLVSRRPLGIGALLAQAVATSIDALAVGVSLLAQETAAGLPFPAAICSLVIGCTTFLLSVFAVVLGKTAGDKLADRAGIVGGFILVFIGCKLLIEGI